MLAEHLSFISSTADAELARIRETVEHAFVVDGRGDVEAVICRLLAAPRPATPRTLDLIGHSTSTTSLLALGNWVIDASNPCVTAFFRELAEQDVLARLNISAVRLLGCTTADTAHGKWTVCALSEIVGVEVYGTSGLVLASHYNAYGFAEERRYLLASASELRSNSVVGRPLDHGEPSTLPLDVDAIPATALPDRAWPVRVVGLEEARELLSLVRRRHGSILPGLVAAPMCELALPSAEAGKFHLVQVLLGGELVRVYPAGQQDGVVYPVDHPFELRTLVG